MKTMGKGLLAVLTVLGTIATATSCANKTSDADGYLTFDINPSVELIVENGKIAGAKGANDDAYVLLSGENLTGLSVAAAGERLVDLAARMGYIVPENKTVKINVVADDEKARLFIEQEARSGAEKGSAVALVDTDARRREERAVKDLQEKDPALYKDLTPAKLRLIDSARQFDATLTYEKGATLSIAELLDILDDYEDEYEDLVSDELEDRFEKIYAEKTMDLERRIAAIYDEVEEGYLSAYEKYKAFATEFKKAEEEAKRRPLSAFDAELVARLLALDDAEPLKDDNGNVTVYSIEDYLDDYFASKLTPETREKLEKLEDALDDVLDLYDEDNYVLSAEEARKFAEAALQAGFSAGKEIIAGTSLDFIEDIVEPFEEEFEDKTDEIEDKLDGERKARVEKIEREKETIKADIRAAMKDEIEKEKERLAALKKERLARKE